MPDFAYTTVAGKIPNLLKKIKDAGVPPKVNPNWLKSVGFTSSNDSSLIPVLKQIELIDGSNAPTSAWNEYRGAKYAQVLGRQIRKGYAGLFEVYSDANNRTQEEIENVFTTKTTAGKQAIGKTYATFKALCALADFPGLEHQVLGDEQINEKNQTGESEHKKVKQVINPGSPSVHIDIQIHIAPESTTEQIDQIFKSMAKHLYGVSES